MPRFRIYAKHRELCPFHGTQSHMNSVYSTKKEDWALYSNNVGRNKKRTVGYSPSCHIQCCTCRVKPEIETAAALIPKKFMYLHAERASLRVTQHSLDPFNVEQVGRNYAPEMRSRSNGDAAL